MNHSSCFNLMFKLASVLSFCLGSAKGVSNEKIFAFHILEFEVISNDSAEYLLKSQGTAIGFFNTAASGLWSM